MKEGFIDEVWASRVIRRFHLAALYLSRVHSNILYTYLLVHDGVYRIVNITRL